MNARDAAEVIGNSDAVFDAGDRDHYETYRDPEPDEVARILAALAAAAAEHGVVTAGVKCPNCEGIPWTEPNVCPTCTGTGTVRVVVHLADANWRITTQDDIE